MIQLQKCLMEVDLMEYNWGGILFQLVSLGFLVIIIALIVMVFRTYFKRKNQLNNIEKKINHINEQIKRNKD